MKISRRLGLGLAIVVAAALTLLLTSQASASFENIGIERITVEPGEVATVDLFSEDIDDPGLGAWEIGIIYNPSVVEVVSCNAMNGSVCNPEYASNQVRVTGASASGLEGDATLAALTFRCDDDEGTTSLTLALDVIADATIGSPQPIDAKRIDGSITCTDSPFQPPPPGPTPRPTEPPGGGGTQPTATLVPGKLPDAGTGSTDGGYDWLIAASAAGALAAMASLSLLAIRRRNDR